jgi:hypothetical protein
MGSRRANPGITFLLELFFDLSCPWIFLVEVSPSECRRPFYPCCPS